MPNFVRISDNKYVNLDDVRDIYIHNEKELEITVTWRGLDASIDVFEGEEAVRLMGLVHLCSIASLRQMHSMTPTEAPSNEPPDSLTLD